MNVEYMNRHLKRFFLFAGGFVLIALFIYVFANIIASRTLEKELEAIRHREEPLLLSELAPSPIPDSENAATYYVQAFRAFPSTRAELNRMQYDIDPALKSRSMEMKRSETLILNIKNALAGSEKCLSLLRRASAIERCDFHLKWKDGDSMKMRHLSKLRQGADYLSLDASLASRQGRVKDAETDILTLLAMAKHIGQEPTLFSQLFQYMIIGVAKQTLEQTMEIVSYPADFGNELDKMKMKFTLSEDNTHALIGERCFGIFMFDSFMRDPVRTMKEMYPNRADIPWVFKVFHTTGAPMLKIDEAIYLRYMDEMIADSKKTTRVPSDIIDKNEAMNDLPACAVVTRMLLPAIFHTTTYKNEAKTDLELMKWAVALRNYHITTGSYPKKLSEMVHGELIDAPIDPCQDETLTYQRAGEGFTFTSSHGFGCDDRLSTERAKNNPVISNVRWSSSW